MENKNYRPKRLILNLILTALIPAAFFITLYFKSSPEASEQYAQNVYPFLSGVINQLSSLTSVSIAEIAVLVFFSVWIIYLIATVFRLIFKKGRFITLISFILDAAAAVGVIYFCFTMMCGINYYRATFTETAGYTITEATKAELTELFDDIIGELNEVSELIERNEDGTAKMSYSSIEELAAAAAEVYDSLNEHFPTLRKGYGAPKAVGLSELMSYTQITGVFFPFTYEANVNVSVPYFTIPATMCHELTHLRGYMREDEANFIAYLACAGSDIAEFRYSGLMLAYVYTASALYSEDSDSYYSSTALLDESVKIDLRAKNAYWEKYEGLVSEVSEKINDTYLKINDQSDGTKSYGRMIDLLLAEKRAG